LPAPIMLFFKVSHKIKGQKEISPLLMLSHSVCAIIVQCEELKQMQCKTTVIIIDYCLVL